jgi:hypothetical protein
MNVGLHIIAYCNIKPKRPKIYSWGTPNESEKAHALGTSPLVVATPKIRAPCAIDHIADSTIRLLN